MNRENLYTLKCGDSITNLKNGAIYQISDQITYGAYSMHSVSEREQVEYLNPNNCSQYGLNKNNSY